MILTTEGAIYTEQPTHMCKPPGDATKGVALSGTPVVFLIGSDRLYKH